MRLLLIALFCLLTPPPVQAWNAAGHRLTALIAWEAMSPASRRFVSQGLRAHPDHARWVEKSGTGEPALVFAEASIWPDAIRHDPRFHDAEDGTVTTPLPGHHDMARHRHWHYADFNRDGVRGRGEIDLQIGNLLKILRSTADPVEFAWALPWFSHLLADLHQPMHVGYSEDRGGNSVLIENPFDPRQPFIKLHAYWDDRPGPSSLRGKKLRERARQLIARHPPPDHSTPDDWLAESRAILPGAYPQNIGSVSLIVDENFRAHAQSVADRRIVAAGYRLGWQLEAIHRHRVPRETQGLRPGNRSDHRP